MTPRLPGRPARSGSPSIKASSDALPSAPEGPTARRVGLRSPRAWPAKRAAASFPGRRSFRAEAPRAGTGLGPGDAASGAAPLVRRLTRLRRGPASAGQARRPAGLEELHFSRGPLNSHKTRKNKFQKISTASEPGDPRGAGFFTVENRAPGRALRLTIPSVRAPLVWASRGPDGTNPQPRRPRRASFFSQPVEFPQNPEK